MKTMLRNSLVVIGAILAGWFLNSSIINSGLFSAPLPEGVNPNDLESIKAHIHLYTPANFINPFIAHIAGSLLAGLIVGLFTTKHKFKLALIPGFIFFIGGIMMVVMLPKTPIWFIVTDLLLAYFPMVLQGTFVGHRMSSRFSL